MCPPEQRPGSEGEQQPQEVCGSGDPAHAGPGPGRSGDEALREGPGLPRSPDRITHQLLGPQRPGALPLLCSESL